MRDATYTCTGCRRDLTLEGLELVSCYKGRSLICIPGRSARGPLPTLQLLFIFGMYSSVLFKTDSLYAGGGGSVNVLQSIIRGFALLSLISVSVTSTYKTIKIYLETVILKRKNI